MSMVGRTEGAMRDAQLVRSVLASVGGSTVTRILRRFVSLLRDMPRAVGYDSASRVEILPQVAQAYIQYFRAGGTRFE